MNKLQAIAARAADLMESRHFGASTLRGAFSMAVYAGAYAKPSGDVYPDYAAIMAFEGHWIGEREHRNDGLLISETAADRADRVGLVETVQALRAFAMDQGVE